MPVSLKELLKLLKCLEQDIISLDRQAKKRVIIPVDVPGDDPLLYGIREDEVPSHRLPKQ